MDQTTTATSRPGMMTRAVRSVRRPGVSGRVLGTMLLPLLLLAIVSVSVTVDQHRAVVTAEQVTTQVGQLETLLRLRSAVFAERMAEEISLPDRRPPDDLLVGSRFASDLVASPDRVTAATEAALSAVPVGVRPFTFDDLAAVRVQRRASADSTVAIRDRWEPLQERLSVAMDQQLARLSDTSVELGVRALAQAIVGLEAAIRAPGTAADLLGALSDLWLAEPPARPMLQSRLAAADADLSSLGRRFGATGDAELRERWLESGAMPVEMRRAVALGTTGVLTDADRAVGVPIAVGLALLEGIDWAGIDWAVSMDHMLGDAAQRVQDLANQMASETRHSEQTVALLALVAIAASLAAALLFGRSIVAPVRRLTDQAIRVGRGELDVEPLELGGPPEVVAAGAAFNDVVDNLVLLERKTHALADCDFDDPSLAQPLPGMLGASLQRSVRVLSGSIIERQQLQQRLVHQATHDALTGLANRAELVTALTDAHHQRRRVGEDAGQIAVVFIDLDDFKRANDRYGHAVGDELLKVVAQRLQAEVRRETLVARLGGDEFVVVMSAATGWHEPVALARRLVRAVAEPVEIEGHWLRVGASAGVALSGSSGGRTAGPLDLLRRADMAVYSAKQRSGDPVAVYDDEMDQLLVDQEDIEDGLAEALQRSGELSLVYQPMLDALTGSPAGVEVLVRWHRGERGSVSPGLFVPIAERSGLVVDLDLWVLDNALAQMAAWADDPAMASIELSVNVSGRSLLDPAFVDQFAEMLAESGVDPRRLVIEVTETALVTDLDLAAVQLQRLRTAGVRVAIDDFGTGYTSVAHLRALPVDQIKIDSSFVHGLPEREQYVLIQMINELAHRLDVPTVAEGVETTDQADALREIGCDLLQGFLFAEPMPEAELTSWLRAAGQLRGSHLNPSQGVVAG